MKVLVDDNNVIILICKTANYQENGNILVDEEKAFNKKTFIDKSLVTHIYELEKIPEGVCRIKWCYTEEQGFYKNENYEEPMTAEKKIEMLEQQITDMQLALVEMYEMGVE